MIRDCTSATAYMRIGLNVEYISLLLLLLAANNNNRLIILAYYYYACDIRMHACV